MTGLDIKAAIESKAVRDHRLCVKQYELGTDVTTISAPECAKFLAVKTMDGVPRAWALVDPDQEQTEYKFRCFGTGHHIDKELPLVYIDTTIVQGLVLHYFLEND